jgi:hypothetical protein
MLHLKLPSISAGFFLVFFFVLASFVMPIRAVAQTVIPGVSCSMVNGVDVCTQTGTGGQICVTSGSTQDCENLVTGGTSSGTSTSLGTGLGSTGQSSSSGASPGWLSQLSWWIANAITQVFDALVAFLRDLVTYILGVVLGLVSQAIAAIGTPSWLSDYSLGSLLGNTGSVVGFFMSALMIPQGFTVLGLGYVFRLVRKFVTLFQW